MDEHAFDFVDLFAGIGGFHAALTAFGGRCVYASEIDPEAAAVYKLNWGLDPLGDITEDTNDEAVNVPAHDLLAAGFPCQPFSKSGEQRGMDETRGTLFWNILRIIEERTPKVVLLENVRNLAGPRHRNEWEVIVETLQAKGYRVAATPAVFSPHLLPPERGGRPQVRERIFITATHVGDTGAGVDADPAFSNRPVDGWDPQAWDLASHLPLNDDHRVDGCDLNSAETLWINAWADFVKRLRRSMQGRRLPGFPLWADHFVDFEDLTIPPGTPKWKQDFLVKNAKFYTAHRKAIDAWIKKWDIYSDAFPPSRRKLEWQAQDTPCLWDTVMHLRPSGIRAKAPSYVPALVAITQTSIVGPRERRLSVREAARLQGLPDWFSFGNQRLAASYKQLGNGVSVGAIWHVLRAHVARDQAILEQTAPTLVRAVLDAPQSPDRRLNKLPTAHQFGAVS